MKKKMEKKNKENEKKKKRNTQPTTSIKLMFPFFELKDNQYLLCEKKTSERVRQNRWKKRSQRRRGEQRNYLFTLYENEFLLSEFMCSMDNRKNYVVCEVYRNARIRICEIELCSVNHLLFADKKVNIEKDSFLPYMAPNALRKLTTFHASHN